MNTIKMVRIGCPLSEARIVKWRPGQIIYCDENEMQYVQIFEVPDPAHQSSLDYLKGI